MNGGVSRKIETIKNNKGENSTMGITIPMMKKTHWIGLISD